MEISAHLGKEVIFDEYSDYFWGDHGKNGQSMVAQLEYLQYDKSTYQKARVIGEKIATAINVKMGSLKAIPVISYLNDLITSPVKYNPKTQEIFFYDCSGDEYPLLLIRGWGSIQHMFKDYLKAQDYQDKIGQFIVDAINEYLKFK